VVKGARAVRQHQVDNHIDGDEHAGEQEEGCISHPSSMPFFSLQR
jgi:hypothetical protein